MFSRLLKSTKKKHAKKKHIKKKHTKKKHTKRKHTKKKHNRFWDLLEYPFANTSRPYVINSCEYIILGRKSYYASTPLELYKYNINTKTWSLILKLDKDDILLDDIYTISWTIDIKSLIVYIIGYSNLITINLNNNEIKRTPRSLALNCTNNPLLIDDKLHLIDNCRNQSLGSRHIICDENLSSLNVIQEFDNVITSTTSFDGFGFVHIRSKQMMLLFGGWISRHSSYDSRKWYKLSLNASHDNDNHKWIELDDIKFPEPLSHFGFAVTTNEEFIIIMGGCKHPGMSHKIYVFDVNKFELKQSKIECPVSGYTSCVFFDNKLNNDLLTYGYIRDCYKQNGFENINYLSHDLILLISEWIRNEQIYGIFHDHSDQEHWSIDVKDILSQLI